MIEKLRIVSIGEMVVSADPNDVLVVFGLGSCVVVCLYDPVVRVGSMLHALLPNRPDSNNVNGRPTKYVDEGVPLLIDSLVALGAKPAQLRAYLCGGAQMIIKPGYNDSINVGERNLAAAEAAMQAAGLKIQARATGGHTGRTVKLYVAKGQVTVKMLNQEEQTLV